MIDSNVSFNSYCQWIPTKFLLYNIEIYEENFERGANVWCFKAAQRQWDKQGGEEKRVSSDIDGKRRYWIKRKYWGRPEFGWKYVKG